MNHLNNFLITYLPKRGMNYGTSVTVLGKNERDQTILEVFKANGFVRPGNVSTRIRAVGKRRVEAALVAMFGVAAEPTIAGLMTSGDQSGFETAVQERTPWARDRAVDPRLFAELLHALIEARHRWHDKPRWPHSLHDHCDLAKAIDSYLEEQSDWGRQLFELVHGGRPLGEEEEEEGEEDDEKMEEEEEDKVMADTQAIENTVDDDDEDDGMDMD